MSAFLANMLHGRLKADLPEGKGRVVSFNGSDSDVRLATGSMRERVLGFLYLNGMPSASRDIAAGINCNQPRVTKTLKDLVSQGDVTEVKHDECVMEYALTKQGQNALETSTMFRGLANRR